MVAKVNRTSLLLDLLRYEQGGLRLGVDDGRVRPTLTTLALVSLWLIPYLAADVPVELEREYVSRRGRQADLNASVWKTALSSAS